MQQAINPKSLSSGVKMSTRQSVTEKYGNRTTVVNFLKLYCFTGAAVFV